MTDEQLQQLEYKINAIYEALPTIEALGRVLVNRQTAIDRTGLNKNTLDQNPHVTKYEEIGKRKTFIEIGELSAIKQRKPKRSK